jgi:hypothetical protein
MNTRALLVCLLGFALAGCSHFEKRWNAPVQQSKGPLAELEGRWSGRWVSETNGHEGALRCIMSPTSSPGELECQYHAVWAKVLRGTFTIHCRPVRQSDGSWKIIGSQDLGTAFGGLFNHEGTIRSGVFEARYKAAGDFGKLKMQQE